MDLDTIEVTTRAPNLKEMCLNQCIILSWAARVCDWISIRQLLIYRTNITEEQVDTLSILEVDMLFTRVVAGVQMAATLMALEKQMETKAI